jgi:hypothetical protein
VSDQPPDPRGDAARRAARLAGRTVHAATRELETAADEARAAAGRAEAALLAVEERLEEPRWPAAIAIAGAIVFSALLPGKLTFGPPYALPVFEAILLATLMVVAPQSRPDEPGWHRTLAICMIAVINLANVLSLAFLIDLLFNQQHNAPTATRLMLSGVLIWVTNVLVFGLWFWELDAGGPHRRLLDRAHGRRASDLLFPQMTTGDPEDAGWRPGFVDYLFVSFTTATAFSPTDTMPMSRGAKALMMCEALVSLATIGLVAARAVNIIK